VIATSKPNFPFTLMTQQTQPISGLFTASGLSVKRCAEACRAGHDPPKKPLLYTAAALPDK
jgi:hypothetical protein